MGTAQDGVSLDARRNRDRAADPGIGSLGMIDDFFRRRIQRPMVIRFHPNSNPITLHIYKLFSLQYLPENNLFYGDTMAAAIPMG
jgi:hypothetical protein